MKYLFQALEARFNANPTLKRIGRKLHEGLDEKDRLNVVKPFTEINAELVERLDTFDADVERWNLEFRYHAKDLKTNAADDWVDAMTGAFKDGNIISGSFHCCGCRMMSASVPRLVDGAYSARARFQLIIQRKVKLPLVRV